MIPMVMQHRRLPLIIAAVLAAALVSISCTGTETPPPDDALESPEALRGAIDARLDTVEDARFRRVVLEYFGDGDRVRVRQLILVERPDKLRVQTRLPGSDEIVSLLVTDGQTFALHEREDNTYYTGAPTRENINRLLPVDLSAADLVRVMLGGAPWDRFERDGGEPTLDWDREQGKYRYSVRGENGNLLSMYVRHPEFVVDEVRETDADGEVVYAYTTRGWDEHEGLLLPSFRRFQWPERDLDFSVDSPEVELNVDFPPTLFEFPPPPGSRIVEIDE